VVIHSKNNNTYIEENRMHKRLFGAFLALSLIGGVLAAPTAHAASIPITFRGFITKNGHGEPGEPVVLRCKEKNSSTEEFIDIFYANNDGSYSITTNSTRCPLGSFAHLLHWVNLDDYDTSVSTVVRRDNVVNIEIGTITYPIPEYNWAGGAVASVAGIGTVALVRRKYIAQV
jgi:hypothetical protein